MTIAGHISACDAQRADVEAFVAQWHDDSDFICAHTSGSTGEPKDICLKKSALRRSAQRTAKFFGLTSESRLHLCLSPSYIAGKMMIVRALTLGCQLTCEPPSNRVLADCAPDAERISLIAVVPSQLNWLINNADRLPRIDVVLVGGAPLNEAQIEGAERLKARVCESYGMTETASHVALRRVGRTQSPFRALDGFSFSLDARGCLVIESDDFGRLVTNDVARLLTPKQFYILGRYDDAIISGGVKIFPRDVERAAASAAERLFPGCAYCVCGVADEKWGAVPALALEVADRTPEVETLNALKVALGGIADHKLRPSRLILCNEFPRTESGKIIRRRLCECACVEESIHYS